MRRRTTPMNLNQRTNEKMRKTHRSVCDKGIQKHTSLYRNGVQMRDGPNRMASDPKEKIMNLGQLSRRDPGSEPHWIEVPVIYDIMSSRGEDSS